MQTDYDVIIVGGRVAGSTLAARLGRTGSKVLLLERAQFPQLPAVSCPIIYAPTMQMLDEIGADEAAYARDTPQLRQMTTVTPTFTGGLPLPEYKGRAYAYAIDRARFDTALWETAVTTPNVTGWQNFSVTDLLWDGDRVSGIVGKPKDGDTREITARVVVGADGRFGIVGRKVNAQTLDVDDEYPTSIYYAYWKNVTQLPDGPTAAAYPGDGSYGYLVMDSADGQTVIAVEGRADVIAPENGDAQAFYLAMLKRDPGLWARACNAEMVTTVRGMRNIGNSYRQAGGPGWALIGDAYHQKDPLDGQGIYNAVVTSKALAISIRKWQRGDLNWTDAIAEYDERARVKTYPMYKRLQTTIRANFYAGNGPAVPTWAQERLERWIFEDETFMELMGQMLTRQIPADMMMVVTPPAILGALARGPLRDARKAAKKRLSFLN